MSAIVPYCTREDVKSALDVRDSTRANRQVDRLIKGSTESIEGSFNRVFYPMLATRYFDWPNWQSARAYRLWLENNEVISVTSITTGGIALSATDYILQPVNEGPPFTAVEMNIGSRLAFTASPSTWQNSIVIAGLFGYNADEDAAGALAGAVSTVGATTINVTDGSAVGVGSLLRIDNERMLVTDRTWLAVAGQVSGTNSASSADTLIAVTSGAAFVPGEMILLDGERMLITDIAGNNLVVNRAQDGTVLAAHNAASVYASRTLTVTRGFAGTAAATHSTAAPVARHRVPGLVSQLAIAETLNALEQEGSAYARVIGSGDNQRPASGAGLNDLRSRALSAHGRFGRVAVI